MRYTVRLYATPEQEQRAEPVATVVLTDQRQQAGWLPERVAAEVRLFLERIDTPDATIAQRVRAVLQQPSMRVARASAYRAGAVRTRGDYTAEAPYGSPAYWRVAVGRLQSQADLRYDLQDYERLLDALEVANGTAEVPVPTVADRSAVLRQCSFYLLRLGREGLWAGKAIYDVARQQWTVPVHDASLGGDVTVGEIVLDAHGMIHRAHLLEPDSLHDASQGRGGSVNKSPEEAWLLSEEYDKLLQITFAGPSPPHQLLVFGFYKLLEWKPREIVEQCSDVPLKELTEMFVTKYMQMSKVSEDRIRSYFERLRRCMDNTMEEVINDTRTRAIYNALLHRVVGETTLRDYYTHPDTPTADISHWWSAVARRVLMAVRQEDTSIVGWLRQRKDRP
jgi:hypothetical protein